MKENNSDIGFFSKRKKLGKSRIVINYGKIIQVCMRINRGKTPYIKVQQFKRMTGGFMLLGNGRRVDLPRGQMLQKGAFI